MTQHHSFFRNLPLPLESLLALTTDVNNLQVFGNIIFPIFVNSQILSSCAFVLTRRHIQWFPKIQTTKISSKQCNSTMETKKEKLFAVTSISTLLLLPVISTKISPLLYTSNDTEVTQFTRLPCNAVYSFFKKNVSRNVTPTVSLNRRYRKTSTRVIYFSFCVLK